jgi:precorrin-8X/cobalt-precorrin-8 methylmutase
MQISNVKPQDIEKRSFEIITEILGENKLDSENEHIVKRCIHTSADFEYAQSLYFSKNVSEIIENAIKNGADIVTDTQMAKAGINKATLKKFGGEVHSFISDDDVALEAKEKEVTRASVAVEKAFKLNKPIIFAIGNAPTALIKIYELIEKCEFRPEAIIAVSVGFVNVVESKELIMSTDIPCIVARGRKGGSNIAAAICNAILYKISENR